MLLVPADVISSNLHHPGTKHRRPGQNNEKLLSLPRPINGLSQDECPDEQSQQQTSSVLADPGLRKLSEVEAWVWMVSFGQFKSTYV